MRRLSQPKRPLSSVSPPPAALAASRSRCSRSRRAASSSLARREPYTSPFSSAAPAASPRPRQATQRSPAVPTKPKRSLVHSRAVLNVNVVARYKRQGRSSARPRSLAPGRFSKPTIASADHATAHAGDRQRTLATAGCRAGAKIAAGAKTTHSSIPTTFARGEPAGCRTHPADALRRTSSSGRKEGRRCPRTCSIEIGKVRADQSSPVIAPAGKRPRQRCADCRQPYRTRGRWACSWRGQAGAAPRRRASSGPRISFKRRLRVGLDHQAECLHPGFLLIGWHGASPPSENADSPANLHYITVRSRAKPNPAPPGIRMQTLTHAAASTTGIHVTRRNMAALTWWELAGERDFRDFSRLPSANENRG